MADSVRKPHPDVDGAIKAANTSRQYHVERVNCMDGTVAERYERLRNTPPNYPVSNPPVGEYCIALVRNSADVNASPQRLNSRPETSLLAPYLGMMITRNMGDSAAGAEALNNEFVKRAETPVAQNATTALRFGTTTPPFVLTQGVALDAAFTKTVMDARHRPGGVTPPLPTRSKEELYAITDSCFRNTGVTIGQCVQAGKDQAALYLNQGNTVSQVTAPAATPSNPQQRRSTQRN